MIYQVFTDGSSSRKNKTIGTSYIIFQDKNNKPIKTFCKGFQDDKARNGIAELLGVYYFFIDICTRNICIEDKSEIIIYSDSQYVVKEFTEWFRNQMMKKFFDTKNKEVIIYILWMLYILRQEGFIIKFQWIKGHQREDFFNNFFKKEVFGNNWADRLAVSSHKEESFNNLSNIEDIVKELQEIIRKENILENIRKIYLGI